MNEINSVHTPCKNCVFAIYENNTQNGCALNYISKYTNKGLEILEAYDEDKEFYIINGKKCIGYREPSWFNQFNLLESSLQDKIDKFYETNRINYALVINLEFSDSLQLENMLRQAIESKAPPDKIILIRYNDQTEFSYHNIKELINKLNITCEWRIQSMVDKTLSYIEIIHNITAVNMKHRFFLMVEKPSEYINKIAIAANKIVYEDLDRFLVLTTPDQNCLLYAAGVYRFGAVNKQHILADRSKFKVIE